jgi:CheY-like chemotaxis protein
MGESQSTILVVEDDDDLRGPVMVIIGKLGYRVVAACSGDEALRIVENDDGAIAVLFTDVEMPGRLDGFELARRATAIRPTLKVIYTTGDAGKASRTPGQVVGSILYKPYRAARLAAELRRAFDEE